MKKNVLILIMFVLSVSVLLSSPNSFRNVNEKMYRSLIENKKTGWVKTDTTKVYFNLDDNLLLFENQKLKSFDILKTSVIDYDNSKIYNFKTIDDKNNLYYIEICQYVDGNMIMTIYNDKSITRYKFKKS